jgi:alcohol dehydrogenase class IV
MASFGFETTRSLQFAPGASAASGELLASLGVSHALLVTDPGLVASGAADRVERSLRGAGIAVTRYTDVVADPPEAVVLAAARRAQEARIDGVIGLGGGSSMDVAKLIAVLACSDQPLQEMYGIGKVRGGRLPLVQIPTTAGTGSEVTPISIVTTGNTTKSGVVSPQLLPDLAILDPELTLGLPPAVTAATGIDAMVHAIEAYTSRHKKNPYSDMLARQALALLSASLSRAVHHGDDLEARGNMLLGAMLAGQAFANAPVAAVHALAYPLGGHYHVPHGLSNALVLLPVLRFNAPVAAGLYAELLPCIDPGARPATTAAACEAFIDALDRLITDVALPRRLRDQGVTEAALPMLAADAMLQQRLLVNNPREVGETDALAIYRSVH